jgi:hypothetical protein
MIIKLTGMFSSTFSCAFLVCFVLFLANRPRLGHRIAFFDLVTRGMTEQIASGITCSRKECSRKELWGWAIKLQVCSFFLIQVICSTCLLELHYQANHLRFVHLLTLRLNICLRLQSSGPLLCLTECLTPLCLDSPLLSPRVVSTSHSLSASHVASFITSYCTLLLILLTVRPQYATCSNDLMIMATCGVSLPSHYLLISFKGSAIRKVIEDNKW